MKLWCICEECGDLFDRDEAESEFNVYFHFDLDYDMECEGLCGSCAIDHMEDLCNGRF